MTSLPPHLGCRFFFTPTGLRATENYEIEENFVLNLVLNQNSTLPELENGKWFWTRFWTKLKSAHFAPVGFGAIS
jgi:hypothetical protein